MRRAAVVLVCLLVAALCGSGTTAAAAAATPTPTGLTATVAADGSVTFTWQPVKDATSYALVWGETPDQLYPLATTSAPSYVTNIEPEYRFYVAVQAQAGRRNWSPLSAPVAVVTPPQAPFDATATVEQPDRVRIDYRENNPRPTTYSVFVVHADGSEQPADVVEQFGTQFLVRTEANRSYVFRLRAEWDGVPSIGFTDLAVTTPPRLESSVTLATPQPVPAGDTALQFEVRTFGANVTGTIDVSIDGAPATTVELVWGVGTLDVQLTPGSHTYDVSYSGDGGSLPSSESRPFEAVEPLPGYTAEIVRPEYVSATAVGDVTCDGRADLVAAYSSFDDSTQTWGPHLDVWPGGSDGSLGAVRSVVPPTDGVSDLATGDVTGDGCADVVLANGDVWVLAGASSGLRAATRLRTVAGVGAVEIADLTGDRANDLVVGNGTVTLLAGNGRGGFAKPTVLVPAQVDRFDVGDLDGDGRPDLVVGTVGGPLRALRQTATGSFAALWSRSAPMDSVGFAAADVTGDGKADVVIGGDDLAVLDGATGEPVQQVAGVIGRLDALATGDVDGDGDADTLAWQASGLSVSVTSDGVATALQRVLAEDVLYGVVAQEPIVVGDLGSDGRPDIVVSSAGGLAVLRAQT